MTAKDMKITMALRCGAYVEDVTGDEVWIEFAPKGWKTPHPMRITPLVKAQLDFLCKAAKSGKIKK